MTKNTVIPLEVSLKLCNEIRAENKNKPFSLWRLQCWGCCRWSRGVVEKMCLSSERGCNLVNERYKLGQG